MGSLLDMNQESLNKLINEALAIEAEEAKEAGSLGFMARSLVQATLPHSKQEGNEFTRRNGLFTLSILSPKEIGLPYGSIPRLLVAWVTTEAVKTRHRQLILGHSLSDFMEELDLMPTGGRWGTIIRLKTQMQRLFASAIRCFYGNDDSWAIKAIDLFDEANLWWNPKDPNQASLFESTLTLSEKFFNEAINAPVPIDMRALKALSKSPLALDIYCWLTYRMSYLKERSCIPWGALQVQFGSGYALNTQGTRDFKRAFLRELKKVGIVYPEAKVDTQKTGLMLKPSKPHIPLS
jgi:hypothetical protein